MWKSEAFDLWESEWASIYEEGSPSRDVIKQVADSYYLVSVVDNDYINGNLFEIFGKEASNGAAWFMTDSISWALLEETLEDWGTRKEY